MRDVGKGDAPTKPWNVTGLLRSRAAKFALASLLVGILAVPLALILGAAGGINADDVRSVPQMKESTRVYDRRGGLLYEFYEKKRTVVPLSKISPKLLQAMISIEDRNFYHHPGFDPKAMTRAVVANLGSRRISQGASTITQQLARNTFLSAERSYKRKFQELLLALKIEHSYSKEQILEFYANRVYLGSGFYGVEAASQGYFGKSASDLSLGEAALLAGIIKAPAQYSPHRNLRKSLERRSAVLDAMNLSGYITRRAAGDAKQETPAIRPRTNDLANSSYAVDYIRDLLTDRLGYEMTFNGGLQVYTSIDPGMQSAAELSVGSQLERLDRQRRADSPKRNSRNSQPATPLEVQGALLSMDIRTGEVYALVGGRDYRKSKFNRAIYARRQPGSAFKPFVFTAALEAGMTPATLVDASGAAIETPDGLYMPANSDGEEFDRMTLRRALRNSVNTAAIQVGQTIGLANIIRCAQEFGINDRLPEVASLPLGSGEVTLLELVRAYSAFPNGGKVTQPHLILRVDRNGRTLYAAHPEYKTAVDVRTAFLMTSMLSDVVDRGTAYGIRSAGYAGPVAGKTGTSNEYRDAWFIGFTPEVVTGVWVGFDVPRQISPNGYAATVVLPVWIRFMKTSFPKPASSGFLKPPGIVQREVCASSGQLATPRCRVESAQHMDAGSLEPPSTYMEYFSQANLPPLCSSHPQTEASEEALSANLK
jgi:1A family penicillin-binding protein